MKLHPVITEVTQRIRARSQDSRSAYLATVTHWRREGTVRARVSCANLAHAYAAEAAPDKLRLREVRAPNIGIVSAYNDILSAHQPLARYPDLIKAAAREAGAVAQFAGGVPAMCDGVTQGQPGMELSLFSRDVIAMSTAIALSHGIFDGALCLGVCDKIVPGLVIGALHFGHLPIILVPGGPMSSGLANDAKAKVRQKYAQGLVDRSALLEAESQSYHGPGTCTFYGTANSNQFLMEVMGLHIPGAAFVPANSPLRDAITRQAALRVAQTTHLGENHIPIAEVVDERCIVNAIVGLLATGGSTNHTIHLVAMARAAGILINWDDFDALSAVVPLLTRIYPNGVADVNHFHAAAGVAFVIRELISAGLLDAEVTTVFGQGLAPYTKEPFLDDDGNLAYRPAPAQSADLNVLRPVSNPFSNNGGLRTLEGNLGRAVIKTSAVKPEHLRVRAPAIVFDDPYELEAQFKKGALQRDFVAVLRYQGPRARGMPELHQLTPILSVLQDQGFHVALVTDGRMSGASGKVPAAIHVSPECAAGGPLTRVQNGDMICLDCEAGILSAEVSPNQWTARKPVQLPLPSDAQTGMGRELFAAARANALTAEEGASSWITSVPIPSSVPVSS